jgi:hypothetical protein
MRAIRLQRPLFLVILFVAGIATFVVAISAWRWGTSRSFRVVHWFMDDAVAVPGTSIGKQLNPGGVLS